MAKQTFTTGQVLTAAQMTSLQQTAMLGGAASAKTASYTLVAADAGTAISMSNASATTITVNTALFAAGDTVNITNLGAGVCTITAGTATVNSSASLALAQYESGTLDFTSTSAAIFIKGAGAAASSGISWSLLNSGGTALTGATTITVSGISGKNYLMIILQNASANASANLALRFNSDTNNNYGSFGQVQVFNSSYSRENAVQRVATSAGGAITFMDLSSQGDNSASGYCLVSGANTTAPKVYQLASGSDVNSSGGDGATPRVTGGYYTGSSVISSVSITSNDGNFDNGTIYVYASA
jgi:hypothetical protein